MDASPPDPSRGYDRVAGVFLELRDPGTGAATVRRWARELPSGGAVLDLGCGSGIPISQALREEGLEVYGIDASPAMVSAFRERFPASPVACEPVEGSGFFARTFDAVVAWGLIFLLEPETQLALIRKVAAALEDGGRFLFTAPWQRCRWTDLTTGGASVSLGREAYAATLASAGLALLAEHRDEGGNHYYDAQKR